MRSATTTQLLILEGDEVGISRTLPAIIAREGSSTTKRFLEFFTANIRNPNTRLSYARAVGQFLSWCETRGTSLHQIEPIIVAAYIEQHPGSPQTVKQHLAAIRMLFDWLVIGSRSYRLTLPHPSEARAIALRRARRQCSPLKKPVNS